MRTTDALLASLALLIPLTSCKPTPKTPQYYDPWCSADTSDAAVVDFAQDPSWGASMHNCLDQLKGDTNYRWFGVDCQPAKNGTNPPETLGPSFGFYKGNKNVDVLWDTCFDKCKPCLAKGIDNMRAVTTKCTWKIDGWGSYGGNCWMGFDYGK